MNGETGVPPQVPINSVSQQRDFRTQLKNPNHRFRRLGETLTENIDHHAQVNGDKSSQTLSKNQDRKGAAGYAEGHTENSNFVSNSEQTSYQVKKRTPYAVYWNSSLASSAPNRHRYFAGRVKQRDVKSETTGVGTIGQVTDDAKQRNEASNFVVARERIYNEPANNGMPPKKKPRMRKRINNIQMLKISASEHGRVVEFDNRHSSHCATSLEHPSDQTVEDKLEHSNQIRKPVTDRRGVDYKGRRKRDEKVTNPPLQPGDSNTHYKLNEEHECAADATALTDPVKDGNRKRRNRKKRNLQHPPNSSNSSRRTESKGLTGIDEMIDTFDGITLKSKESNQHRSLMDLISEVGEKQKQQQILLREIESRLVKRATSSSHSLKKPARFLQVKDRRITAPTERHPYVDSDLAGDGDVGPEPSTSFQTCIENSHHSYHPNGYANGTTPYASPVSGIITRSPSYSPTGPREPNDLVGLPSDSFPDSDNVLLQLSGDQSIPHQSAAESNDESSMNYYYEDF